jgi:superfamily II DNA/RNA helicase
MQALPLVLSETSVLLIGPSGCGKTLSYLLPIVCRVCMQDLALNFDDDEVYAVVHVQTLK